MSPVAGASGGLWGRLRGLVGRGGSVPRGAPSFVVTDLLERGRRAKPGLSALDAVMGEDWALVDFDRAGRPPVSRAGIAAAHARDVARFPGGGPGFSAGRDPQAVVKMIRTGGASDIRGLRAQMAYLSRQGEEPLCRSERYMGAEIDADQAASLERAWAMPETAPEGGADRTSHLIVSFPEGTPVDAAEQAGRDWAEAMFGSGEQGGDSYDYYTAFHTDRAHPHMHVVVHRRGLERGDWLKVSRRSDITYDRMREVLVGVSREHGIHLEATPRYARGIHERPVPDAEYRRASAERREPEVPAHTPETALRAAAGLIHYARGAEAGGRDLREIDPTQAERLQEAGRALAEGRELRPTDWGRPEPPARTGVSARVAAQRETVTANFRTLDGKVMQLEPVSRVEAMRRVAASKVDVREALGPQGRELDPYLRPDPSGRYDGDPVGIETRQVGWIAERYGVDVEAAVARLSGGVPSEGLARDFARAEADERAATREERSQREESPEEAEVALDRMHREIAATRAWVEAERHAEQERREEEARWAEEMRQHEEWRAEQRREAERRAREDAERRAADRGESETDRWIREREEQERNDRDGGRGL